MRNSRYQAAAFAMLLAWLAKPGLAAAGTENVLPEPLREVSFEQRLGAQVPLDLRFRDESGKEVALGDYFRERPVILTLVYYECPMLCTLVLNGLTSSMKAISFAPGREFAIITVSFNPRETPALAAAKKASYLALFGRPEAEGGWHFLTGDEDPIRRLTEAVGFKATYDAEINQYAHAAGILILTPEGEISRVFYGIEYAPRDVRLGLVEASRGKIGTLTDQLLLYCFHYDPAAGKYGAAAINLVRAGGVMTVLAGTFAISRMLRRERRERRVAIAARRAGGDGAP